MWFRISCATFTAVALVHAYHFTSVDRNEFWPAVAEWHAAKDRGDADGVRAAYHKEEIAHCRTGDLLWWS